MSGIYSVMTRNLMVPGSNEYEALVMPNDGSHIGRRGVVLCHGYTNNVQNGIDFIGSPGVATLVREIAKRGVCVLPCDLGGTATFGNDLSQTRIGQARSYLAAQGCATDKVLLLSDSMGNWAASRYAADNPGQVASILALEPGVDLNSIRDNNIDNARNDIDIAWGLTGGSTSTTVPLPTRADIMTRAANGELAGLRYRAYYSTADAIAVPSATLAFVASIGATADAHAVPGTPAHGSATTSAVPFAEAADWLVSAA